MTETQERFLRSVLTRVPLDVVVELHLFPPIRRGTMETGVAVIATLLPPPPLAVVELIPHDEVLEPAELVVADTAPEMVVDADMPDHAAAVDATLDIDGAVNATIDDQHAAAAAPVAAAEVTDDDSPYADESPSLASGSEVGESIDEGIAGDTDQTREFKADDVETVGATAPAPSPRMRILTAAYRHTIKGIDRGKWTVDVQEEADAPLEAVELVLRGVRHRSTEPADPELVSLDALAALIAPVCVAPAA